MAATNRQLQEIVKCGKDPTYFFNRYAKIQHPMKGSIPFTTYPFQDDVVQDFIKHRYNIILKSRQLGLSTVTAAYCLWLALFYKDQQILVIATRLDTAMNFMKKVKYLLSNLPKWLILPGVDSNNKTTVDFDNGSMIKAVPRSEDAGRSEALSLLIVDEAAFVRDFVTLWEGLFPTLTEGGRAIVLSTPNGASGLFYELYTKAEQNLNQFNPIFLPWQVHPEHDDEWFKKITANMSEQKAAQEYSCEFLASGDTYISPDDIAWIASMIKPPLEREGIDKNVWVWKRPQSKKKYIISADVSRGSNSSADYSTFHIIDVEESEVVAEYKGRMRPDRFGELLVNYGRRYNNALVCPEANTFGFATLVKMEDLGYPNIYFEDNNTGVAWVNGQFGPRDIGKAGFMTKANTRDKMLAKLEEVIRNKQIKIYSKRFYTELTTFIVKNNRPQAGIRANDDLVISLGIGVWLYDASEAYSLDTIKRTQAVLDAMGMTSNSFENLQNSGDEVFKTPFDPQDERYNPQRIKMEQESIKKRIEEHSKPKKVERAPARTMQDFQKQFGWLY